MIAVRLQFVLPALAGSGRALMLALLSVPLVCLAGCGGGGDGSPEVETAPVSGTVTLNGAPLAGAEVHFVTENFSAFGQTDENGAYRLVQGAAVGSNKVYISKLEVPEGVQLDAEEGMDLEQLRAASEGFEEAPGAAEPVGELIPPEYSDPEQSKLEFNVPAGGTDSADFQL